MVVLRDNIFDITPNTEQIEIIPILLRLGLLEPEDLSLA